MAAPHLQIKDLHVSVEDKEIVKGLNLDIHGGEIHAIMGPNGTGKSTLSSALMGHPAYKVTSGTATLDGEDLLSMAVDERGRAGMFLAMQYPAEVSGVSNANFLRTALNSRLGEGNEMPVIKFHRSLQKKMKELDIDPSFADRYLNEGFSGGEKKRNEILQMAMLEPRIAILDEIDSGLDIDALKVVSSAVNSLRSPETGFLIITHYQRLLQYIEPDFVHIMMQGRIVKSGDKKLAEYLEANGYDGLKQELGIVDETVGAEA
ncbi:Fe-S cluster assembly ATPase SufC [Alicyclobacillus sp. SO9]|uniref:Fe-S cluster assembly ATPase SufC n=1 Tax=Alicyclobacillus sp. SO9 TaxID=2665646 RepID=UPI0018E7D8A8|nr:Fe-S cluster assembly ATPase SufC [Alicyclobacillus sp. SO9]QQE81174.1 Fe-S cluster assembly ATPase SufC [Alicyclobacillus sp. SO9]